MQSQLVDKRLEGVQKYDAIPAISIMGKKVVVVSGDKYTPVLNAKGKPVAVADFIDDIPEKYRIVYIVDIDGIQKGRPQLGIIREISSLAEIWLDAGLRFAEGAFDLLIEGVECAVMGTKTLSSLEEFDRACEDCESIGLCIDYADGKVISRSEGIGKMTPVELAKHAEKAGAAKVFFVDLGHAEGAPLDMKLIGELAHSTTLPLYIGTVTHHDAPELSKIGVVGGLISAKAMLEEMK